MNMMIWRANFWIPFAWGLLLLLSWVGWGAAFQRVLKLNRGVPVGWALRAGWGMSAVLAVGGVLNALRLVSLGGLMPTGGDGGFGVFWLGSVSAGENAIATAAPLEALAARLVEMADAGGVGGCVWLLCQHRVPAAYVGRRCHRLHALHSENAPDRDVN